MLVMLVMLMIVVLAGMPAEVSTMLLVKGVVATAVVSSVRTTAARNVLPTLEAAAAQSPLLVPCLILAMDLVKGNLLWSLSIRLAPRVHIRHETFAASL
jgi:hypothetical protein